MTFFNSIERPQTSVLNTFDRLTPTTKVHRQRSSLQGDVDLT